MSMELTRRHIFGAAALALGFHLSAAAILVGAPEERVKSKTIILNFEQRAEAPPTPPKPKPKPKPEMKPKPEVPKPKPKPEMRPKPEAPKPKPKPETKPKPEVPKPKPKPETKPKPEAPKPDQRAHAQELRDSYYQIVWEKVRQRAQANKPRTNRGGKVVLETKIAADGNLLEAKVKSGGQPFSGHALRALRAAAPFPPFPPQITDPWLPITMPISYRRR